MSIASNWGVELVPQHGWRRRERERKRKRTHCRTIDELFDAIQLAQERIALPGDLRLFSGGGGEPGVEDGVLVTQATHLGRRIALLELLDPALERGPVVL